MTGITFKVDTTRVVAFLDSMPGMVHDRVLAAVTKLTYRLQNHIQADKLSGQVLNVVTGNLRRSIFSTVSDNVTSIVGSVASSSDVKYGAIHEYGGTTPPHEIVATKAKALAFMMNGQQVFFKSVHHPGSRMPERSFMRSALADMQDEIKSEIAAAITGLKV